MEPPERPRGGKRKLWLQGGPVPRTTYQRWSSKSDVAPSSPQSDFGTGNNNADNVDEEFHTAEDGIENFQEEFHTAEDGIENFQEEFHTAEDGIENFQEAFNTDEGEWNPNIDNEEMFDSESSSDSSDSSDTSDSEDSLGEDGHVQLDFLPEELYNGASHSTGQAIQLLMDLYSKKAMTKSCMKELVPLIHKLLPPGNSFPRSFHLLQKHLKPFIPPKSVIVHYVCDKCLSYLGKEGETDIKCRLCPNSKMIKFYELSVARQLKYLFERRNLADAMDDFRGKSKAGDIINGAEYIRVKSSLPGQYDIILIWNTDGVSPHKNGIGELWPITCTVCEVAPQLRPLYTMVVGLWHHKKKPDLNMYLIPLVKSLKVLREEGVKWVHPKSNVRYVSKVAAPVASLDAPARAAAQNIHYHAGEHSFNICEIKGRTLHLGARSHKHIFPISLQPDPLRTRESMLEMAQQATADHVIVKGVKGPSILQSIPECDISKRLVMDYLHLVLLGVVRQFFELWFTKSGTDWYIGRLRNLTNFLKTINSLYEIPRCPKNANWKRYKASTWRAWLLFISLPALKGRLKEKYFQHWMLFVKGIAILLQENVSEEERQLAENLLSIFVRDTQELYGWHAMTYNVHNVLHLVRTARLWGNLWSNSTFNFESWNGILTRLLHGTRRIGAELCNTLNLIVAAKTLNFLMKPPEGANSSVRPNELLSPCRQFTPNTEEGHALMTKFASQTVPCLQYFARAVIKSKTCTSVAYPAEKATDNKTVRFLWEGSAAYGVVSFYCMRGRDMYAVIRKFDICEENYFKHQEIDIKISHIIPVKMSDLVLVVPVSDIYTKVFRVHDFVCEDLKCYEQKL